VFEVVNDDMVEGVCVGYIIFDLVIVNCIMAYLEEKVLTYGAMFKDFCFSKKLMIQRRQFVFPFEQNGLTITKDKQDRIDADQTLKDIKDN
jgi:hypothetical protein